MRIAVTGALGFVGRHFVEAALTAGHHVTALYRSTSPEKRALRQKFESRGVQCHLVDVEHIRTLLPAMQGADAACHFASAFREMGVPDEYFRAVNVTGTQNALESAVSKGVKRFVYCSTAGIYGPRVNGVLNETAEADPCNIYEQTKFEAEEVVRKLAARHRIEYAILRPAAVYGPHDKRLLKMFKAAARGRFPLFGHGNGRRHMVYVGDVASAALRLCVLPSAAGQELIVAGPRALPLHEVLQVLARALDRSRCGPVLPLWPMLALAAVTEDVCKTLGVKAPIYRRRMDFYRNDAAFDCSRARNTLGWTPTIDLDEGFARTVESYRQEAVI